MSEKPHSGDRPDNVISLRKAKAARNQRRAEGRTFCEAGFHKWKVVTQQRFDVKVGKLVTAEQCERCGKERVRGT
jgi:hypothetical protein